MRGPFFFRLAWSGLKKNSRLYMPYLITMMFTVMSSYILKSLSLWAKAELAKEALCTVLGFGDFVAAFLGIILLFYANSVLTKSRSREMGVYHVLGMGKKGLRKLTVWETLITFGIGTAGGIVLGILFSKLAEIVMCLLIGQPVQLDFSVSFDSILSVVITYAVICALLMLFSLIRIQKFSAVEFLKSGACGEKAPKANWALAVGGLVLLAAGFALGALPAAVQVSSNGLIFNFFIGVLLVIAGTYLLFIAGSVTLCRILQKTPSYYYKKNHFVAVSTMAFRMKRNGAGLASICILSTMMLVTLFVTAGLYLGSRHAVELSFPTETNFNYYLSQPEGMQPEITAALKENTLSAMEKAGLQPANELEYTAVKAYGTLKNNAFAMDQTNGEHPDSCMLIFVDAADYNRIMKTDLQPGPNESYALFSNTKTLKSIDVENRNYKIIGEASESFPLDQPTYACMTPYIFMVVDSLQPLEALRASGTDRTWHMLWYLGCDFPGASEQQISAVCQTAGDSTLLLLQQMQENGTLSQGSYSTWARNRQQDLRESTMVNGGMLFIGAVLSIVFVMGTVIIMYYKQISEGFEDQGRFGIMKKVGMTSKEIQSTVNSQMLTVFLAPAVFAGLNLVFASPTLWTFLRYALVSNTGYLIAITGGIFAIYVLTYIVIYKLTANAYTKIINV